MSHWRITRLYSRARPVVFVQPTPHPSHDGWRKRRRGTPSPLGRGLFVQIESAVDALVVGLGPRIPETLAVHVDFCMCVSKWHILGQGSRILLSLRPSNQLIPLA